LVWGRFIYLEKKELGHVAGGRRESLRGNIQLFKERGGWGGGKNSILFFRRGKRGTSQRKGKKQWRRSEEGRLFPRAGERGAQAWPQRDLEKGGRRAERVLGESRKGFEKKIKKEKKKVGPYVKLLSRGLRERFLSKRKRRVLPIRYTLRELSIREGVVIANGVHGEKKRRSWSPDGGPIGPLT